MNLDTYDTPDDLYLARGSEVNPNRPLFTGDVFRDVAIPGAQEQGMGLVVAHPCSFRVGEGGLADRVLVASVDEIAKQGANVWRSGHLGLMPLTDLDGDGYWAGKLEKIGRSHTCDLQPSKRVACLSAFGINMLQQRLTCHLTRVEVPTSTFYETFAHTFEEAELLEDWTDTLVSAGWTIERAASSFEVFLRAGSPSLQDTLLDAQQRFSVRRRCRAEAARLASLNQ